MRALISFAALFLSIFLVQLGSGSLAPLDVLSGVAHGFTTEELGILGSAHFAGFFAGCWLAPRLIGTVGHSRCFSAAAAIGAAAALLHPVLEGPAIWAALRMVTGLAIATAYTVIESWLQAKVENRNRGRVFGIYRVIDMSGQIVSQAMIAVLEPASYVSYNIVAVFCCLCLLPLSLSRRAAPKTPTAPRLRPLAAFRLSPLACIGIVVAGLTASAFRMVGPIYGIESGLNQGEIGFFLAIAVVAGAAAQFPVGWIADKVDRRSVLIGLSALSIAACLFVGFLPDDAGSETIFLGAVLFGLTTYPVFSVSAAYANDRCPEDEIVELNAALMFYFSVGAILSPVIAARLIEIAGPGALFLFVSAAHAALIGFALYRMARRDAQPPVRPYRYLPRTSMVLARLTKRTPENGTPAPAAKGGKTG